MLYLVYRLKSVASDIIRKEKYGIVFIQYSCFRTFKLLLYFLGIDMEEIIKNRISECRSKANDYDRWLRILRIPNILLVGGGSLLAFLGGAAIINNKFENIAGYMALVGGALTGLHGWFGCETHQQKCRSISAQYTAIKLKYEALVLENENKEEKLKSLEQQYAEFVSSIDAKPWV